VQTTFLLIIYIISVILYLGPRYLRKFQIFTESNNIFTATILLNNIFTATILLNSIFMTWIIIIQGYLNKNCFEEYCPWYSLYLVFTCNYYCNLIWNHYNYFNYLEKIEISLKTHWQCLRENLSFQITIQIWANCGKNFKIWGKSQNSPRSFLI